MFTEAVLQFAPWSFSKHGALQSCPSLFYRSYVKHEKGIETSSPSKVGTAVHGVLEAPAGSDTTANLLDHEVKSGKLTQDEHNTATTYMDQVDKFNLWQDKFCEQFNVTERYKELEAAIDVNFAAIPYNSPSALMRGKMDVVMRTGNNDLIIMDHKTGRKRHQDEHAVQLYVYQVFGLALYPDIRSIQTAIHHVADGSIDWERPKSAEVIRTQLYKWMEQYLNKHDRALKNILLDIAPTHPSWQCNFCRFKNVCEDGIEEIARQAEKKLKKKLKVIDGIE